MAKRSFQEVLLTKKVNLAQHGYLICHLNCWPHFPNAKQARFLPEPPRPYIAIRINGFPYHPKISSQNNFLITIVTIENFYLLLSIIKTSFYASVQTLD